MVNKREEGGSRWYLIGDQEYPSVTTILSVIAKHALVAWSAKVEREMVTNVSADLYCDVAGTKPMSKIGWLNTLQNRLGKEKAHKKALEKAGDIGKQIHSLIEWTLKASLMQEVGKPPEICSAAQMGFSAWEVWRQAVNLKTIFIEQTVWSDTHCVAGTMDLFCELSGEVTAKHWLTGKPITKTLDKVPAVLDWKSGKRVYAESFLQNAAYRSFLREMGHGDPQEGLIVRLPKVATDPGVEVVWCPPEEDCLPQFYAARQLWVWARAMDTWKPPSKEPEPTATPDGEILAKLRESIALIEAGKHVEDTGSLADA